MTSVSGSRLFGPMVATLLIAAHPAAALARDAEYPPNGCGRAQNSQHVSVIENTCAFPIEAHWRSSDGKLYQRSVPAYGSYTSRDLTQLVWSCAMNDDLRLEGDFGFCVR